MVCAQGGGDGRGGLRGVGGGRGNLRENREDPAPTVGRLRGFHCASNRAQRPPIGAALRIPSPYQRPTNQGYPSLHVRVSP